MLADQQHPVDRQFTPSLAERFGDCGIDLHPGVAARPLTAQIILSDLFDIQRHHIHFGTMMSPLPAIALQEAVDDVLGVRILVVDRGDGRNARTPGCRSCHRE